MPDSLEAECAVLGAMLLEGEAAGLAIEALTAKDFVTRRHQDIFSAIEAVCMGEDQPDELTVRDHLERQNKLDEIGADYLHELASGVPSAANLEAYASQVKEASQRRTLRIIASDMLAAGKSDVREAVDGAMSSLCGLAADRADRGVVRIGDILQDNFKELERRHKHPTNVWGLATGLKAFDFRTGGLHPGNLCILAAKSGVGKTAMLLTWFDHIISGATPCLLFSLEMRRQEIINRLVSMRSGLSFGALMSGRFREKAWEDIVRVNAELQDGPLFLDDTPGVSLAQIHAKARQTKAQHDVQAIGIDYVQIMSAPKAQSRAGEVAALSGGLKRLARELDIPVILLSQFRKGKPGEEGRRPTLEDLKETSALRQDADVVIILHRKQVGDSGYEGKTRFGIEKQRNGPTGALDKVTFLHERMKFVDGSEGVEEEQQNLG